MHRTHLRYTTLAVAAVGFISTWLAVAPLLAQSPSMTRRVVQRDSADSQLQWSGRYGRSNEPDELKWTAPKSGPITHRRVSHKQSTSRRVSAERSIVLNNAGTEEVEYIDAEPLPSPAHGSVYHPHNYGVGDCDCEGPHSHGHPQLVGNPTGCGGNCSGNCSGSCNDCCTVDCCTCMRDSCDSCDTSYCCREMSFFGGVQGFKGPVDLGQNGNFGFHGGLNVGMPLFQQCGISTQLGARAVQTSLHGNSLEGPSGTRDQTFVTLGVFHRTYHGVQWGFAYDLMSDDYYVQSELTTMRGELSYVCPNGREVGFSGVFSGDDDNVSGTRTQIIPGTIGQVQRVPFAETWQPVNQYRLFFRQRLACGGYGRIFGGGTGEGDGLVGGDFLLPVSQCFSLNSSAVYLIPEESGQLGISQEAWNIGISLVWTPGRRGCDSCGRTRRITPLFDVADNGIFLVDRF